MLGQCRPQLDCPSCSSLIWAYIISHSACIPGCFNALKDPTIQFLGSHCKYVGRPNFSGLLWYYITFFLPKASNHYHFTAKQSETNIKIIFANQYFILTLIHDNTGKKG